MAFVQCLHAINDAAGTTLDCAITASSGNLLAVHGCFYNTSAGSSAADATNGTYEAVGHITDGSVGASQDTHYKEGITGGSLTVTLTTPNTTFRRVQVAEYSGLATSSVLEDHKENFSASFGTGTDATTSTDGSGTTTDGDTIVSWLFNANGNIATVGTGFNTARDNWSTADGDCFQLEDRVQATHGTPDAGTWTEGTFGTDHIYVSMLAFKGVPAPLSIMDPAILI
jgi:hypothetical protein